MTIKGRTVWAWTGLKEEDIAEVGSSLYCPSVVLCVVRLAISLANLAALIWIATVPQLGTDLKLLWIVDTPRRVVSAEFFALLATAVASALTSHASNQHSRSVGSTDVIARVAGPSSFAASTMAVFALVITPPGVPGLSRIALHGPPLAAIICDTLLAARLRYRLRAAFIPMGVVQSQQGIALLVARFAESKSVTNVPGMKLLGFTMATMLLGFASVLLSWFLSRLRTACEKKEEAPKSILIDYPKTPQVVAKV